MVRVKDHVGADNSGIGLKLQVLEDNSLSNQFLGEQCEVEDYKTITVSFQYITSYSMIVRGILKHSNLNWQLLIRLKFDLDQLLKIRSREQWQKLWTFFT